MPAFAGKKPNKPDLLAASTRYFTTISTANKKSSKKYY
jgi:hypothetical protein